jgi:hypothetical protein
LPLFRIGGRIGIAPAIKTKREKQHMNIIRITLATIALGFSLGLISCSKAPEGEAPAPEAPAAEPAAPAEAPAEAAPAEAAPAEAAPAEAAPAEAPAAPAQ